MLANAIMVLILGLLGVMSFVNTAKLAQSHNWSTRKTRFFFVFDVAFALLIVGAIVQILATN